MTYNKIIVRHLACRRDRIHKRIDIEATLRKRVGARQTEKILKDINKGLPIDESQHQLKDVLFIPIHREARVSV